LDEFFQKLRDIQKKERNNSGLARVGNDFYHRVHRYLEELRDTVGNDPFAKEQYLLRDTQRIATEICERREHKITDSAVMNIQRSYHLFKGKPQFDLQDTTPLNLTPEEEQLYFSLIDILKGYRDKIIPSLDALDEKAKIPKHLPPTDLHKEPKDTQKTKIPKTVSSEASQSIKAPTDLGSGAVDESVIREYLSGTGSVDTLPRKDNGGNNGNSGIIPDNKEKASSKISEPATDLNSLSDLSSDSSSNEKNMKQNEQIIPHALKTSKTHPDKPNGKINLNTLVIFDEIPSIVGVDEKVYGPFCPQDVVILPEANAQIFIKARKGRLIRS